MIGLRSPSFQVSYREYKMKPCCRVVVAFALLNFGCNSGPSAPELRDSAVYSNAVEGFRFRVPEEWTQTANSVLPAGKIAGDVFLVRYQVKSAEPNATLSIICRDDVSPDRVSELHAGPSFGVERWTVREPVVELSIAGRKADRIVYEAKLAGQSMLKHATCFHSNGRLYSFVALFSANDEKARQQVERAASSVLWD